MKKKWIWITAIVLLFTFPLTACSSNGTEINDNSDGSMEAVEDSTIGANDEIVETEEVPKAGVDINLASRGKIDNLVEFTDAWTEMYGIHESTINAYTGMPIMSLVMVGLPLANAIFYSMLNLDNVDGNFSGNIGFGGTEGYYNKAGDVANFGKDWIRDADGVMSNDKAGDRILTNGLFDASIGYFYMEDSTMRNDQTFTRTNTEFFRSPDGSFICLYQVANDLDYGGDENKTNTLAFIAMSEDAYDFVTATGTAGTEGKLLTLTEGMTLPEATTQLIDAGYTINETGGIQNGVFVVD